MEEAQINRCRKLTLYVRAHQGKGWIRNTAQQKQLTHVAADQIESKKKYLEANGNMSFSQP